jgi:pimeloyl-ACP methyl ester carboxylesterase
VPVISRSIEEILTLLGGPTSRLSFSGKTRQEQAVLLHDWFATGSRLFPGVTVHVAERVFTRPHRYPAKPWEEALRCSGTPVRTRDKLALTRWGSGPPILLVHGWDGRGTQLGALVAPLVDRGFSVYALDGPAHGRSPGHSTDANRFTEALLQVGLELGPFRAAIGHSFGGTCLPWAATRGLAAERLVLMGSPAGVERIVRRFGGALGLDGRALSCLVRCIQDNRRFELQSTAAESVGPKVHRPGLVVQDRQDPDVSFDNAEAWIKFWPEATLLETSGLGHHRILRAPEVLARIADFVSR